MPFLVHHYVESTPNWPIIPNPLSIFFEGVCIYILINALETKQARPVHSQTWLFMIRLRNIRKAYKTGYTQLEVLKGIDLDIKEGEFASIMGSSGSGKSTLLNIIGILDDYDDGDYYLDGKMIKGLSQTESAQYRNRFIGFVFQSFNLLPFKTAQENVALPLYYQKMERRKRQEVAMQYLDMVGLTAWAEHLPNQLSGGQQQRVAIARALITQPKVILADEPTGALDSRTSFEVMELFKKVNAEGMTIIIVTHENDIAAMTHRIIKLRDGVIENDAAALRTTS